jgi:glycosyltransferase involved in cell wall biosynthesis
MKILLLSYAYPPSTGGIERFSSLMRDAFIAAGHQVRVVTQTPVREGTGFSPYIGAKQNQGALAPEESLSHPQPTQPGSAENDILRRPTRSALRQAIQWADLCHVSGLSLHYQLPIVLANKPLVITHHGWQQQLDGSVTALQRLKLFACRFGLNIAVNRALAADLAQTLRMPALAIPNPAVAPAHPGPPFADRPRDIVFVGRLVSEKGVPTLLEALALLRSQNRTFTATIVGDGPQHGLIHQQAAQLGLDPFLHFTGQLNRPAIANLLADHRILAVPSIYKEAFGFVVVEALAAGCIPIGSHAGGLPESIGPCGLTVPMSNPAALAAAIASLLDHPDRAETLRAASPAHLDSMSLNRVTTRYLQAFTQLHTNHVINRQPRTRAIRQTLAELTEIRPGTASKISRS